jgi:hypothetical protein
MARTDKFTIDEIARALDECKGFITLAAKRLGCHYSTITTYIKKNPKLEIIVKNIQESHLDNAEFQLLKKINAGDLGAICFYLKCKGKHRGYMERQEHTGKDGGPLNFAYNPVFNPVKAEEK